ncbi:MAG: DUF308 domain-containing protein [Pseudomonadota bacterium]
MSNWLLLVITGILFVVAGIFAFLNPFAASLAMEIFAGICFVLLGGLQIIEGIRADTWGGRIWSLILGLISLIVGIYLLTNPLKGLVALTIVLGASFVVSGIVKAVVGFRVQDNALKFIVVIAGLASLALGVLVLANIPGSAVITLGIMLGVELVSNGAAAMALGFARKQGGVSHS